jgi:hypothetical protein
LVREPEVALRQVKQIQKSIAAAVPHRTKFVMKNSRGWTRSFRMSSAQPQFALGEHTLI